MATLILHRRFGNLRVPEVVCCPECDQPAVLKQWRAKDSVARLRCRTCHLVFTRCTLNYTKEVRQ